MKHSSSDVPFLHGCTCDVTYREVVKSLQQIFRPVQREDARYTCQHCMCSGLWRSKQTVTFTHSFSVMFSKSDHKELMRYISVEDNPKPLLLYLNSPVTSFVEMAPDS
jgi:hypothetical protein